MSVAENLYLAAPQSQQPAYGDMETWAARKLEEFGLSIPANVPSGSLSLAQRQLLEVVKALLAQPKVLLLDEPTTALGPEGIEQLHALVFERSRTGVGVMYVSHRLPEVLGIADRITVLRDGVSQGTFEAAGMSEEALVALMIGRPLGQAFPDRDSVRPTEVCLEVAGLQGDRFGPIDLQVHRGEILGIAGAEGNGQVQFLRSVAGVEQLDRRSPVQRQGAGYQITDRPSPGRRHPAERRSGARVPLPGSQRAGEHHDPGAQALQPLRGASPRPRARRPFSISSAGFEIRTASIEQPVQSLSGGNQQKVSLTRPFLRGAVHAILADEPTQGVDVGLSLRHLRGAARKGEGRRGDRRQVERPARARGPLRSRRRHVARHASSTRFRQRS